MDSRYSLVLVCGLSIGLLLLPLSCGGSHQMQPRGLGTEDGLAPAQAGPTLEQALAQVGNWNPPELDDSGQTEELRRALAKALADRGISQFTPAVPTGDAGRISDLRITGGGEDTVRLEWTYVNTGDYDQNGEVNVNDLTPIALYFGYRPAMYERQSNPSLGDTAIPQLSSKVYSQVDGDLNGEVNIADITPLAVGFANTITGYEVFSGGLADLPPDDADPGAVSAVASLSLADSVEDEGDRRQYEVEVPDAGEDAVYWVRPVFNGVAGSVSNPAGYSPVLDEGSIRLIGVLPASLSPGELFTLMFNSAGIEELGDRLTLTFGTGNEVPATVFLPLDNMVQGGMPLVEPGLVTIEAFLDGSSISSVQVELTAGYDPPTYEEFETKLADALGTLDAHINLQLTELFAANPDWDQEALAEELADMNELLEVMQEIILDIIGGMETDEQAAFLAMLKDSGYLRFLRDLEEPSGIYRLPTAAGSRYNESAYHYDYRSMQLTNYEMAYDLGAVSGTLVALLAAAPAAPAAATAAAVMKAILIIYDMILDTWIATDIYDVRFGIDGGDFEFVPATGKIKAPLIIEGLFGAEQDKLYGTISDLLDAVLTALPVTIDAPTLLNYIRQHVEIELGNRLESIAKRGLFNSIQQVDIPSDPLYGKVSAGWKRLDPLLYTSTDPDVLSYNYTRTFLPTLWDNTRQDYYEDIDNPFFLFGGGGEMSFLANFGGEWIYFDDYGTYTVNITVFCFHDNNPGWLWDETKLTYVSKSVVLEILDPVVHWDLQLLHAGELGNLHAESIDGKPTLYFEQDDGIYYLQAFDGNGEYWGAPTLAIPAQGGEGGIKEFTLHDGVPVICASLKPSGSTESHLYKATDASGTSWPATGYQLPRYPSSLFGLGFADDKPVMVDGEWYDASAGKWKVNFYRATDTLGTSWHPWYTDAPHDYQWQHGADWDNIINVSGHLMFTAWETSVPDCKSYLVRADDNAATSWTALQLLIPGLSTAPGRTWLVNAAEYPGVLYTDPDSSYIYRFTVAKNTSGTLWEEPVHVYTIHNSSTATPRLEYINERPSIVFYGYSDEFEDRAFYYKQALNGIGTSWGPAERFKRAEQASFSSVELVELADGPGVVWVYGDTADKEIWFARRDQTKPYPWVPYPDGG